MTFEQIMDYSEDNRAVFNDLCRDKRKENDNCIPFVGAGVSGFVYPCWKEFLQTCANKIHNLDKRQEVMKLINQDYEVAADKIEELRGRAGMEADIERTFGIQHLMECKRMTEQAVFLFPYLFKGALLTTNYDKVLEWIYQLYGVVLPVGHPSHSELLVRALVNNHPMLYKFHGDVNEPGSIILGKRSYDIAYQDDSALVSDFTKGLNHKHLLFLGCSLATDRTVKLIERFTLRGNMHYAILDCDEKEVDVRISELGNIGIRVILYPKGEHTCLKTILERLLAETDPNGYNNYLTTNAPKRLAQRFKYTEEITEFVGRNDQLQQLKNFVESNEKAFSWWAIVGPGGAGKSRLALEFIKRAQKEQLLGVYANYHFIGAVEELPHQTNIKHNSIIVIDYVRTYSLTLGNWIVDLCRYAEEQKVKVRVLLIEREGDTFENSPWITTIGDECFYKNVFEESCYNKSFLKMEPMQKKDIMIIMFSYAKVYNKNFDLLQLETMYDQFRKVDRLHNRPLYAMFIADAWVNESESAYMWGRNALLSYIVEREISIYKELLSYITVGARKSSLLSQVFLAYKLVATVWGDTEISLFSKLLPKYWERLENSASQYQYKNVESMLASLNLIEQNDSNVSIISSIEPDLVGEFFIWTLMKNEKIFNRNDKEEIIKVLWYKPQNVYIFALRLLNDFSDEIDEQNIGITKYFIEPSPPTNIILNPDLANQYASYLVEVSKIHNPLISIRAINIMNKLINCHSKDYRKKYSEKYADILTNYMEDASPEEISCCAVIIVILLKRYPYSKKIQYEYVIALLKLCENLKKHEIILILPLIEKILMENIDNEIFVILYAKYLRRFFCNVESLEILEQYIYRFPSNRLLIIEYGKMLLEVLSELPDPKQHFELLETYQKVQYINPFFAKIYGLALMSIAYLGIPKRNEIVDWLQKCYLNSEIALEYTPDTHVIPRIIKQLEDWRFTFRDNISYSLWYVHALFIGVLMNPKEENYIHSFIEELYIWNDEFVVDVVIDKLLTLPRLLPIHMESNNLYRVISDELMECLGKVNEEYKDTIKYIAINYMHMYAMWSYNQGLNTLAYTYFEKSARLGHEGSKNNMIYMLRRGEIIAEENVLECLFEEIEGWNSSVLCINRALHCLSCKRKDLLQEADSLIASVINFPDREEAIMWWTKLYQNGDVEGVIVLNWLHKHGLCETHVSITEEYEMEINRQYAHNKEWIVTNLFR